MSFMGKYYIQCLITLLIYLNSISTWRGLLSEVAFFFSFLLNEEGKLGNYQTKHAFFSNRNCLTELVLGSENNRQGL